MPIIPVLKLDGSVGICGDYKVMINPVLDVPEHPMPTADDLFTQLNGGEKFTMLDLSSAYQQVLLDEDSWKYVIETFSTEFFGENREPQTSRCHGHVCSSLFAFQCEDNLPAVSDLWQSFIHEIRSGLPFYHIDHVPISVR